MKNSTQNVDAVYSHPLINLIDKKRRVARKTQATLKIML